MSKHLRNCNICRLHSAGWPLSKIAKLYGISRQRVEQILNPEEFYHRRNKWRRAKRLADQSSV